jgi:hypothetical protein
MVGAGLKAMATAETIKKLLPSIIYTILVIAVVFIVYKVVTRFKAGSMAIGGVIADTAENNSISTQSGISPSRVNELRGVALRLAKEMETWKDESWTTAFTNLVTDAEILDIMRNVKSSAEMIVVKNFYNNIFTNNRSIYEDLRDELSSSNFSKVPYVEALY